jgi:hypothetical protein
MQEPGRISKDKVDILIMKFIIATVKAATSMPFTLCFRLLGISLGYVKNAPRAIVNQLKIT